MSLFSTYLLLALLVYGLVYSILIKNIFVDSAKMCFENESIPLPINMENSELCVRNIS
jgi:hypothetical protein